MVLRREVLIYLGWIHLIYFSQKSRWSSSSYIICPIIGDGSFHLSCLRVFYSVLSSFVICIPFSPNFQLIHLLVWLMDLFYSMSYNPVLSLYILMLKSSQIWLYSWYVPIILWALPSFWNKCSGSSYTFPIPALESPISPRSPGSFYWRMKPSLWAKVGNIYIPYIHKLASVFTKIETCIYLVHTNNTAGFILVLSFPIFVTPFSALIIFNIFTYWINSPCMYITNLPFSASPSQALFSHPALTPVPLSPPP